MSAFIGEIAALLTSVCFSFTSTFFTLAGRRVGPLVVNRTRLVLALGFLIPAHWVLLGNPLPLQAETTRWLWLGLSGIVGLVLGDAFLFQAFVWIGPRLSMLVMSLVPVISTFLAWIFLDERLRALQIVGVLVTISGVALVVLERRRGSAPAQEQRDLWRGLLFGLGGATGQALGLIVAKVGLAGAFSPLSGTLIRMLVAAVSLWLVTFFSGQARRSIQAVIDQPRAGALILSGAFTGPFLGVTFSLVAIQRAAVGVASTLMALPPVLLLPVGYFVFQERFGWPAIAGTLVAVLGVAVLFLA